MQEETLIKLLILGESAVGKSCLLLRFVDDKFNETFLTTIGIDFKVRHMEIDGKKVKLQIWDTAGQEKFKTITKAYYRGANGILIVFDLTNRDSFEQTKNWMDSITEAMSDPVDIVLVGNKCDMDRKISREEAETKAKEFNVPYFETSAKENINIDATFLELAKMILKRKETAVDTNVNVNKKEPRKIDITKSKSSGKKCCK
ncbi:ras-related protein Rab-13 [Histomonas meleagridis]|uniref:ras-related protein Rab-13 n=1 Tax=Histomonas meleagridis TaxID=135588 RepID=UPI00355A12F9|nr:ras-related protein Rab-13 [Histomonas meleagridis]KAH0801784.1 ras-related protein Rab-13 [Histomonas meleagridis]